MVQSGLICGFVAEGYIDFEADLSADSGAGDVAAAEKGEGNGDARIQLVLAASEALQLILAEAFVIGNGTVCLNAQ
jgi:hypothetical protein